MKKKLLLILGILFVSFLVVTIVMQFRTVVKNPPVTEDIPVSESVKTILKKSCYDCHSNETKITWLQRLPLVSSLVASDVKNARSALNFSEWNRYGTAQQLALLFAVVANVKNGQMPPGIFLFIHPSAKVSSQEQTTLETYLSSLTTGQPLDSGGQQAYEKAYAEWNPTRSANFSVRNTPDGFVFPVDYRNWLPIAVSLRSDNGTIRLIVGNAMAIDAVRRAQTNPWPDGTILGKIVWKQRKDPHWEWAVVPGTLVQIDFMFRDNVKYASTHGWGWARWLGQDLIPYGGDAGQSANSCISCHTSVKGNNWVFTRPAILP